MRWVDMSLSELQGDSGGQSLALCPWGKSKLDTTELTEQNMSREIFPPSLTLAWVTCHPPVSKVAC